MTPRIRLMAVASGCALALGTSSKAGPCGDAEATHGNQSAGERKSTESAEYSQELTGTVRTLDRERGVLSIDVAGMEDLEIQLPPDELAAFEPGDRVTISLGVREDPPR